MMKSVVLSCLTLYLIAIPFKAQALDTVETFGVGAADFEFYTGFDGIGLGKYEKTVSAEVALGYGFMENFSGTVSLAGEANEYFGNGGGSVGMGIFGTPYNSACFDLDLMLNSWFSSDDFGLAPGLEMNFDLAPDLEKGGIYLRAAEALAGRDESTPDDPSTNTDESAAKFALAPVTELTLGAYWTVKPDHMLLLEYDMSLANNPAEGEDMLTIGGVGLGYNVVLHESVELINQLFFDIPQGGEKFAVGISTGIIVTMPSVAEPPAPAE